MKIRIKKALWLILALLILLSNSPLAIAIGNNPIDEQRSNEQSIFMTNTQDFSDNGQNNSSENQNSTTNSDQMLDAYTTNSVDFVDKITNISISKEVGGLWVPATEFEDGDEVRININYSLEPDDLAESKKIHYQLPEGIKLSKEETGTVYSNHVEAVGSYKIGTDGKIEITFNDDFIESEKGIDGSISFKATVSNNGPDDDGKIKFPGTDYEIEIIQPTTPPEENKYDIKTEKSGKISDSKVKIDYKIVVSTQKGTEDVIQIEDSISGWNSNTINYSQNRDIVVKRIDTNGYSSTVNSNQYNLSWKDNEEGFTIENLPKLGPGERYEVTYSVGVIPKDPNADVYQLSNNAKAKSNNNEDNGNSYISWHKKNIKKSGSYDPNNGLILWSIEINPDGLDLTGWTFKDLVSGEIHGDVMLRKDSGNYESIDITDSVTENGEIEYTFSNFPDEDAKRSKYTIYFSTKATEEEKQLGEAKNTATINEESDEAIVDIPKRELDFQKTSEGNELAENSSDLLKNSWKINIDLPEGNITEFIYEDEILNAVDEKGNDLGADSHYGIASELDGIFKSEIDFHDQNGENVDKNNIEINIEYFDKEGNEVLASDSTTKVKSFKITVSPKAGESFQARYMKTGLYTTYTDLSKAHANAEVKSENKGRIADIERSAESKYKKTPKLSKSVFNGKDIYEYESSELAYKAINGKIKYRVMLTTSQADANKDLILKDFLPEGAKFVEGSLKVYYFESEYHQPEIIWYDGGQYNINENSSYSLNENNLEIKIEDFKFSESLPQIVVYYELDISQDSHWDDVKNFEKDYLNKVTWGNEESQTVTKIKKDPERIDKRGVQLDENGDPILGPDGQVIEGKKPTGRIKYTIPINPAGEDLNKGSNTLTLKDKFSGPDNLQAMLDIESVKLYRYDPKAENNKGNLLSESNYTLSYKSDSKELTLKIPDEMGLVLEYEYTIDTKYAGNPKVSNEVSLDGEWSNKDETILTEVSSSSTASKKLIQIYKVDSNNFKKILPGTKFKLEYWDKQENDWKTHIEEVLVGKGGYIEWNLAGAGKDLKEDTLYKLIETDPVAGYQIIEKETYIIWKGEYSNFDTSYDNSGAANAGIDKNKIVEFANGGGIHYITNKYTELTVNKIWQDSQGNEIEAPKDKSININLYRSIRKPDGFKVTVKLESTASWLDDDQKYQEYSVIVNKSTDRGITITFEGWMGDPEYSYDGKQGTLESNDATLTIPSITKDTVVTITHNNKPVAPNFLDYERPEFTESKELIEEITLNSENNWAKTWDNLPDQDDDGNPYYYTVEEEAISGYTTTYTNNEGIQQGDIYVINTEYEDKDYELPTTGGPGINFLRMTGFFIIITSFVIYVRKRRIQCAS